MGSDIWVSRDDEVGEVAVEGGGDLALRGGDGAHAGVHGLVGHTVAVRRAAQHRLVDRPVVQVDVGGVRVRGRVRREDRRRLPHRARVRVLSVRGLQPSILLAHAAPLDVSVRRVRVGNVLLATDLREERREKPVELCLRRQVSRHVQGSFVGAEAREDRDVAAREPLVQRPARHQVAVDDWLPRPPERRTPLLEHLVRGVDQFGLVDAA